jgi:hypothetical protein
VREDEISPDKLKKSITVVTSIITSSQKARRLLPPFSLLIFRHSSYAFTSVRRSLFAIANRSLALIASIRYMWTTYNRNTHRLASSRLSMGLMKSGLDDRHAATVRIGPKQRKTDPKINILPKRKSTGSVAFAYVNQ